MQPVRVRIRFEVGEERNNVVIRVASIRLMSEDTTYVFPTHLQHSDLHEELFSIGTVKNVCKALIKVGQFRNIMVTLPSEIVPLYLDDNLNFVFRSTYLEELSMEQTLISGKKIPITAVENQTELIKIIEKLTTKLDAKENKQVDLTHIHKQFILQKFQGKENAIEWITLFEKECNRCEVTTDHTKIQILRLFLEQNAVEWYSSTLCKLTLTGEWKDWRESFIQTYGDKSWRSVHYAYTFRFIKGSLLDYALKKERLLLETEPKMSDRSRINHIVVGLPLYIQDRLDKEEIQATESLIVISEDREIFAKHKYDVGKVENHEAHIKLLENKYISKKPYRCSIPDRQEIESQITKLLEAGLIEESESPFAAPVTLAYKKEDGRRSRLCIDFRDLNKILVPESQPFPIIEDIIVKTRNCKCHIKKILQAIKLEGFRLKLSKCNFAQSSVKYLGHIIGCNSVSPHQDNIRSIKDFPRPRNKKNIRQFLGKINFYHKYIPDYTRLMEPLHNLLRKNVDFQWTSECNTTFVQIKEAIYLECLAIKEAIRYWQHWLIGHKFQVVSDHKPLENIKVKARTDEELGDLVYYLSQYDFTIRYAPGRTNQEADALSRNPVLEHFENKDDVLQIVNFVSIEKIKLDQNSNKNELNTDRNT
uniref:RNA-directed DNA polymerase n=1 Tax=Rhodnius prolixus TaxID=13249 RepID=T1HT13_RHOPR